MERLKTMAEVVQERIETLPQEIRARWEQPPASNVNEMARHIVAHQWWAEYAATQPKDSPNHETNQRRN